MRWSWRFNMIRHETRARPFHVPCGFLKPLHVPFAATDAAAAARRAVPYRPPLSLHPRRWRGNDGGADVAGSED